jgi:RNA polymerase sigma-70 factor (ECF subfamily)
MNETDWLVERFEANRTRLRAVAYRMLGSLSEADDAVQEAWLRLSRADAGAVENLGGWLTTVVARVCLDMLRKRKARREVPLRARIAEPIMPPGFGPDLDQEMALAESVGLALLVVLDTLAPAERLAFVLHDMFAVPFDEIAAMVGRSPTAARQLASRARRRIQGGATVPDADLSRQREVVAAFLAASREGNFDALLAVLDPDVILRADGVPGAVRGAAAVANKALAFSERGRFAQPALINGAVGLLVAPRGHLLVVLRLTMTAGRITEIDVIEDPARLDQLDLAVLGDGR